MNWVQLGDVAELRAGVGFPIALQGKVAGDYPFAKVGDISRAARSGEIYISSSENYVDASDLVTLGAKIVPKESILFAKIGEAIRQNFRVLSGCEMLVDNNAMAAIPNERIYFKYLYHYLKSVNFYSLAPSTTVPAIRKSDLQKLQVPIFSMREQWRISKILDHAELLRSKRATSIEKLDELARTTFVKMFGDSLSNPFNWPVQLCKNVCSRVTVGIVVQPSSYYTDGGVPALRSLNIKPDGLMLNDLVYFSELDNEKLSKTRVWQGDVVLVRTGRPGTATVIPSSLDGVNAIDILIVTPDKNKVNSRYLSFFFNSSAGRSLVLGQARGQIQQHLNVGSLKMAEIPMPPLELQNEFANRWEKIDSLKKRYLQHLNELESLCSSLQHRAFRGEL
nr:restriction endonuclease subunit S [uncultured Pseudomonas sp.]